MSVNEYAFRFTLIGGSVTTVGGIVVLAVAEAMGRVFIAIGGLLLLFVNAVILFSIINELIDDRITKTDSLGD